MRNLMLTVIAFATAVSAAPNDDRVIASDEGNVTVHPIEHASFVLEGGDLRIAVDPLGDIGRSPVLTGIDLVLVTDIHGDHFDPDTLQALAGDGVSIVAPAAVAEKVDETLRSKITVLANGESTSVSGVDIEAIPMYNLTEGRLQFHPKGRGNGYVLELQGLRIYIAGDTEGTPEMRALKDIDAAFVPMNLPYTMDVEQAAAAVTAFKPRIVYPYHYRGQDGLSDVAHFAELVHKTNPDIEVRQLNWYPD